MARISKTELLTEFGFSRNPFKHFVLKSGDYMRIGKVVKMAVEDRSMITVVGDRGIGKSNAVNSTLSKLQNTRIVSPYSNEINKLLISDIEQALILDLSSEKPKRGREIRARQLRRILGEASTKMNVVLVIEEAHHLHGMTLRSLKRLREMSWKGETELFSVILVCQSNPMNKPGVSEVRLRSDSIQMSGLSRDEITAFTSQSVGSVFDNEAIEAISQLQNSHNYEDLKAILVRLMETALFAGKKQVSIDDVEISFGTGNLEVLRKRKGISKAALAEKSGLSTSTVSKLLKDQGSGNTDQETKQKKDVLRDVLNEYQSESGEAGQQVAIG